MIRFSATETAEELCDSRPFSCRVLRPAFAARLQAGSKSQRTSRYGRLNVLEALSPRVYG
jgi:hypothetical protein